MDLTSSFKGAVCTLVAALAPAFMAGCASTGKMVERVVVKAATDGTTDLKEVVTAPLRSPLKVCRDKNGRSGVVFNEKCVSPSSILTPSQK